MGIVNYLNTLPLLYGLERSPVKEHMELIRDYPARIARGLETGAIDLGLIPVAAIPGLPGAQIVSQFCIASDGPVASVCLFSQVPLSQISRVLLDYQSKTSVQLLRILLREYWKKDVEYIEAGAEFQEQIREDTAGLLIGDRCLAFRSQARYVYDLGQAWKDFCGLPFVYAAWVANKPLPDHFLRLFDAANGMGVGQIDQVLEGLPDKGYDLKTYFTNNIQYRMDARKARGLEYFLGFLTQQ